MRVVSLLPAATEIVAALGLADCLVGVSHECVYPPEVRDRPRATRCAVHDAGLSSQEIDARVRETLASGAPLYTLDEELLHRLRPDVILTQRLCDVCAVGHGTVQALAATLPGPPRVLSLEPMLLADVYNDIRRVAEALGAPERGAALVTALEARVRAVRERVAGATRRTCSLLEWVAPPFCAGHWNPELVEIAGGAEPLGRKGEPSRPLEWESVVAAQPEVLLVVCCGYPVERTLQDVALLRDYPGWESLPAVRSGRVHVADGNHYFTCPGPRLVDSLEIVAEILHPELFAGAFPDRGVLRLG